MCLSMLKGVPEKTSVGFWLSEVIEGYLILVSLLVSPHLLLCKPEWLY